MAHEAARTRLAAKMVGRWPSGAPLMLAPSADDLSMANENDFRYAAVDAAGLRCPIGAHVRRANPRDSLDPRPGSDAAVAVGKRHRIIRRGRAYGAADGQGARQWVSEDRRSRAARWGAWAPKIRRLTGPGSWAG